MASRPTFFFLRLDLLTRFSRTSIFINPSRMCASNVGFTFQIALRREPSRLTDEHNRSDHHAKQWREKWRCFPAMQQCRSLMVFQKFRSSGANANASSLFTSTPRVLCVAIGLKCIQQDVWRHAEGPPPAITAFSQVKRYFSSSAPPPPPGMSCAELVERTRAIAKRAAKANPVSVNKLASAAIELSSQMNAKEVALSANAFCKLRVTEDEKLLWVSLGDAVTRVYTSLTPQGVALCVNAFSTRQDEYGEICHVLASAATFCAPHMSAQGVAISVNWFSKRLTGNLLLWRCLAKETIRCTPQMDPQNVANCVNGFCKIEIDNPTLWASLAKEAIRCVPQMNPQEVSNCVNGFCKIEIDNRSGFLSVSKQFDEGLDDFQTVFWLLF